MRGITFPTIATIFITLAAPAGAQSVSVQISPPSVSLAPDQTQTFTATVSGSTNQSVAWLVNGIRGGAPSIGIITAGGVYTAPADPATALSVTIEAVPAAAPVDAGTAAVGVSAATSSGPTFYVATTGSDSNPGTSSAPWLTLQHAVDTVPAGATILVASGVYNELTTITRSGSQAAGFISLEAGPGQSPIIDGTGLGIPNGQNGLVTINNASYIRVKGFEIRHYATAGLSVPIGIYVEGAGSHIEILSNRVHNIATTNTTSNGDALGIAIYGTSAPAALGWITIDGNQLYDLTLGFSESLSLSGNVVNWEIMNNLIHDNNNIGVNVEGFFGTAPEAAYDQARQGVIAGNTVYNITSAHNPAYGDSLGADGLYVDGGASVTIQQNVVFDADLGIEMASEVHGHVTSQVLTHDNIVYRSYVTGISIGGAAASNGGTENCVIANNTLFDNDTTQSGSGEFQVQFNASANMFYNNILYANTQGLLVNAFAKGTTPPATLNKNLYFSLAGSNSQWIWLDKTYTGLAAYKTGAKEDSQSLFANPQFVSAVTGKFALEPTSPAIALGLNLGMLDIGLQDEAGQPRTLAGTVDAGALEH